MGVHWHFFQGAQRDVLKFLEKNASLIQFTDMRFDYFEKLSTKQANAFLQRFLDTESSHIQETAKRCGRAGIKMDYSIKSLSPFIRWIVKRLRTTRLEPDPTVPEWVRNTESYTKHLFEFDEVSKELVLADRLLPWRIIRKKL